MSLLDENLVDQDLVEIGFINEFSKVFEKFYDVVMSGGLEKGKWKDIRFKVGGVDFRIQGHWMIGGTFELNLGITEDMDRGLIDKLTEMYLNTTFTDSMGLQVKDGRKWVDICDGILAMLPADVIKWDHKYDKSIEKVEWLVSRFAHKYIDDHPKKIIYELNPQMGKWFDRIDFS